MNVSKNMARYLGALLNKHPDNEKLTVILDEDYPGGHEAAVAEMDWEEKSSLWEHYNELGNKTICGFKYEVVTEGLLVGCGRLWKRCYLEGLVSGEITEVRISNTVFKRVDNDIHLSRVSMTGNNETFTVKEFEALWE